MTNAQQAIQHSFLLDFGFREDIDPKELKEAFGWYVDGWVSSRKFYQENEVRNES
jgi:hypothetical protein